MGIGMVPDLIQATYIARYYSSLMKITWMTEKAFGKGGCMETMHKTVANIHCS